MNKYKNKKVEYDGHKFDSHLEMERYKQLKLLEKVGKIHNLILQPKFELQPSFKYKGKPFRAITYVADFKYYDGCMKDFIIEDVKGKLTEVYKLKKKLFLYKLSYSVEFRELYKKDIIK